MLQDDPDNMKALGGLIRCFVALGELAQARGLLAGLTPEQDKDPAIASARAALELAAQAEKLGSAVRSRAAASRRIRTTTRRASTWRSC